MKLKERELIFKKNGISIINNSFDKFLISIGKNNVSESKKNIYMIIINSGKRVNV